MWKKYFLIILIFLNSVTCQRSATEKDKQAKYVFRFRAADCKSYDNYTMAFKYCYVKAVSRKVTTLNFGYEYAKPMYNFYVQVIINYRYGNIYREIGNTKLMDWCPMMKNSNMNPILNMIVDICGNELKKVLHQCPYEGVNEFKNITMSTDVGRKFSIFPEGFYKYEMKWFHKNKQIFSEMNVHVEVNSPLKESFGRK
jgi:Protein of unknown function (DUF1091)